MELAGVEVLRICNEPTMAALAYGLDQKNMAIRDFKDTVDPFFESDNLFLKCCFVLFLVV